MNLRPAAPRALATSMMLGVLAMAPAPASAQPPADPAVTELLSALTPAQRVGQLFIVPFAGGELEDGSGIAQLIDDYHVGGVVLDPAHDNYTNGPDAPRQVAELVNALQSRADAGDGPFVPLLVTLAGGDPGLIAGGLHGGMTPMPSAMALGATWQADLAARVGEVIGGELTAVGVNMLLGPSLDVLNVPQPGSSGDLGVRTFGGSPPWVGRFGQRFVEGVHTGSGGRVATAAGSFPGIGGADRSQSEEVAVVESSFEALGAVELVPFVAVANPDERTGARSDAFITSHVRYRGIQQQTDRPLSLDSGGLRYLWAQVPELAAWREAGGALVSPGLGLPAVRRYDDPDLVSFNERRVIGEALLAGNDLLLVTDFGASSDPVSGAQNIRAGIEWLVGRYEDDETIRDAVDRALERVLALKLGLYDRRSIDAVLVDSAGAAAQVGLGREQVAVVARETLTLITPTGEPGGAISVGSPQTGDRIVFVVDAREVRECATCDAYRTLDPARLLEIVLRAYGPAGTGRVRRSDDIAAITFTDLKAWLQAGGAVAAEDTPALVAPLAPERLTEVERLVDSADWLVFGTRDVRPAEAPGSDALKLFLKSSPPDSSDRRVVAVAFGAPYYLDTTEIAKLSAYYAVYAWSEPFMEVAVRALFGDETATGASPVSVSGAGYDLALRLAPAVEQVVDLELIGLDATRPVGEGDDLTVRTSVIRDVNGNPAPDGTKVTFRRYHRAEDVFLPDVPATSTDGRATGVMRADRAGELVITAVFDNGLRSEPLDLTIQAGGGSEDVLSLPDMLSPDSLVRPRVPVDWGILLLSLTLILLAGVVFYGVGGEVGSASPSRHVRLFLLSLAWGLAGYLLVAAGGLQLGALPGGGRLWPDRWNVAYQAPLLSFALALVPVVPTVVRALTARHSRPTGRE